MNICIIPARGGSKRIPKKNIKLFRGAPMIEWSITAAIKSKCFDKIIVSTDDDEIAQISSEAGADVPFVRPNELANDFASTREVIEHAIRWLNQENIKIKFVCCLYATAPFVLYEDIQKGFQIIKNIKENHFLFTCTTFEYPIQRALSISKKGFSKMILPQYYAKRSQDLEETYHDAGQFYIGSKDAWLYNDNFFENGSPLLLPRWRVQDIDTVEDWIRAENMHKLIFNKE
tara:strand:+ start:3485 stop:4177 length:693 start_codon:yes stop_codon:yes gene_type:complete